MWPPPAVLDPSGVVKGWAADGAADRSLRAGVRSFCESNAVLAVVEAFAMGMAGIAWAGRQRDYGVCAVTDGSRVSYDDELAHDRVA